MKDSMLAAMYYGIEDVRLEDVPIPEIGPGDILIKIGAATTCGTDIKMFRRGYPGLPQLPMPFGHECAGVIQAVGKDVKNYQPGMRVVAAINAPCGECFFCRQKPDRILRASHLWQAAAALGWLGGYASIYLCRQPLQRIMSTSSPILYLFEEAALAEPLACALYAVEDLPLRLGDTVAIIGGGAIGQMFVMLCKAHGMTVILCEKHAMRMQAATQNGADSVIDVVEQPDYIERVREITGGYGPDITIEATGTPQGWLDAIDMVRRAGTVMLFGGCRPGTSIELNTRRMHYDCLTLKSPSVYHQPPDLLKRSSTLLASGAVNGKALITDRVPLQDTVQALRRVVAGEGLKFAIIPPEMA
jgi:L-iditol 2-dehydrogenase